MEPGEPGARADGAAAMPSHLGEGGGARMERGRADQTRRAKQLRARQLQVGAGSGGRRLR
eukprot:3397388-Pyramimonas_sp.AAC.1